MKASQLRDLTRRYAVGGMTRDDYVAERTRLIDGIVAGNVEIRYRELDPGRARASSGAARKRWWIIGSTIMLVSLLLVALLAHFLGGNGNSETARQSMAAVTAPNPGAELLDAFIAQGEWNDPALASLESRWQGLTPFQQESARRSAFYRQLKHETTQRITEQEALLAAGEMDALLVVARLRDFGKRLGFISE